MWTRNKGPFTHSSTFPRNQYVQSSPHGKWDVCRSSSWGVKVKQISVSKVEDFPSFIYLIYSSTVCVFKSVGKQKRYTYIDIDIDIAK